MDWKAGAIWGGYLMPWEKWVYAQEVGQVRSSLSQKRADIEVPKQRFLMENTTLGIPAIFQTEGAQAFCRLA